MRKFKNVGFQFVTYGSIAIATLGINIFIGRILGPEELGRFSFLITFTLLGAFFSDFGLGVYLIREVARVRDDREKSLNLFYISLGASIFFGVLLVGITFIFSFLSAEALNIIILFIGVAINGNTKIFRAFYFAHEQMGYETIFVVIQESCYLILAIGMLWVTQSLTIVVISYTVSRTLGLLAAATIFRIKFGKLKATFNMETTWGLIKESWPFAANSLLAVIYIRADILLIGYLSGSFAVGIYEAGSVAMVRSNIIANLVSNSYLPTLSRFYTLDRDRFYHLLDQILKILAVVGVSLAVGFLVYASSIIPLLFGDGFDASVKVLMIMSSLIPIKFASNIFSTGLTAGDSQLNRTIAVVIASVVNIMLNLFLIPIYSYWGAVYSTWITEILLLTILNLFFISRLKSTTLPKSILKYGAIIGGISLVLSPLYMYGYNLLYLIGFIVLMSMAILNPYQILRRRMSQPGL